MALQGSVKVIANFTNSLSQTLTNVNAVSNLTKLLSFVDGSGAGQASKIFAPITQYSVSASTNTDIDLSGSLAGSYGTVVFTAIKGILIIACESKPGILTVGNVTNGIVAPFGAATHSQQVAIGGVYLNATPAAAGWTISAGTQDLLRIASAATVGTYTWDILVWGI